MLRQRPQQPTVHVSQGETSHLTFEFEGERPSEGRVLINGDTVQTTEIDPAASKWVIEFSSNDPGEYDVELVLGGQFPDRHGHLPDADALEFDISTAYAEWTVVVTEPEEAQSVFLRSWELVKEGLAVIALVEFVHKVQKRILDRDEASKQVDEDESEIAVTTLDEFPVKSDNSSVEAEPGNDS